jgi:hypothetical protein
VSRDWVAWHRAYDDPASSLTQRRAGVVRMIRDSLDAAAAAPIGVLSLCAGDGQDVTLAAVGHPRAADLIGCLVELDPELTTLARSNIRRFSSRIEVRCGDAGDPCGFDDVLPVDLLILCGIFGNITDDDIRRTISAVPAMCRPGAMVIWTRHRRAPDLTPDIRRWFAEAGCASVELISPGTGGFAVGRERCSAATDTRALPRPLFTFRDDLS